MRVQAHDEGQSLLDRVFTPYDPLGPASLDEVKTRDEASLLFDGNNEVNRVIHAKRPVFLIGRRGSGKTAFLKAVNNPEDLTIDMNSPELISQVGVTLGTLNLAKTGQFTERAAVLWEACFVAAMCSKVWSRKSRLSSRDCPEAFDFGERSRKSLDGRATDVATSFLKNLRSNAASQADFSSLRTIVDDTELNGIPLWLARQSLEFAARRHGVTALISLDSLDKYTDIFYDGGMLATDAGFGLQGLFRAASRDGRATDSIYSVRVSFPAELWHYYSKLSANPLKDFDHSVLLHWDNHELLQISSSRFLKYLETNFPLELRHQRVTSSRFSQDVLMRYLPSVIENMNGMEEPTIPYLLRHTQLLPRHFIHILNLIFRHYDIAAGPVPQDRVLNAVSNAETYIVQTISDSYNLVYPQLLPTCSSLIPELHRTFSTSVLHEQVNRINTGGRRFEEVLRMLVEVGAVGRVVDETAFYTRADFEYLHASRLLLNSQDTLCLHPLFSRGFHSLDSRPGPTLVKSLPVLPLGSDPNSTGEHERYIYVRDDLVD